MSRRSKIVCQAAVLGVLVFSSSAQALSYGIAGNWDSPERRNAADASMAAVVARFNAYGTFDGYINVDYNPGVPTAQASWGGGMTFGGTWPNERVSQHEVNHYLGSVYGHNPNGPRAIALLEQFDGVGARYGNDGTHFWPYGLNYDSEGGELNLRRNVAIMYAFRGDWGIGPTSNPTAWAATNVTLTGSNAAGVSGFNHYANWSDNTFAHANAAYSTGAYDLRTPEGYPSWTFVGSSLTVNAGGRMLFNGYGTTGVVKVNNLRLAGGTVRHDQFVQDLFRLDGNISLMANTTSTFDAGKGDIRVTAPVTGSGSVNFIGSYTTTLAGANAYTGTTNVNAGTLALEGAASYLGAVNVSNGATFRVKNGGSATPQVTTGAFTLGATGSGKLTFDIGGATALATKLLDVGTFNYNAGGSISFLNGTFLNVGLHPLIGYGSLGGTGTLPTGPFNIGGRTTATFVDSGTDLISLNVIGSDRPIWNGRDSGNWTTASTGSLKNWKLASDGSPTDYLVGDDVLFDDSAVGTTGINISNGNVAPAAVTFNNSTRNYNLAGSGGITGGTSLTKNGTGTLTITAANSYTGTTTINAGIVSIGSNANLGANESRVVLNGGTLRTTAGIANEHIVEIGAAGGTINVTTNGQYFFNTANTLRGSGPLNLTGNGTITVNVGNLRVAQTNSYGGPITMSAGGIFEYGTANAVAPGATFTLGNQGELAIQGGAAVRVLNPVTVNGGTNSILSFENGTGGDVGGNVTLNANVIVALRDWYNYANVRGGTISGKITGPGAMLVQSGNGSGGTLTLTNANTYTGGTTVSNSTVAVGGNSVFGTGGVTLNSGTLTASNASGGEPTVSNPITVNGSSRLTGATGTLFRIDSNLTGSGALGLSAVYNNAGLRLGGNNAGYTGTATVTGTNTRLGSATAGSAAANWVVNGNLQTDVIGGASFDLGALSGSGIISGHANNPSRAVSTLRVGALNTNTTYAGRIIDNAQNDAASGNADGARNNVLTLNKVGTGTLTLSGANAYTGPTTISEGTLKLVSTSVAGLAVANYSFDNVSGTTVPNIGSGGGAMNGTLTNGATVVANGQSGSALSVANGGYVNIANGVADLANNGSWAVAAWVKTTSPGGTILNKSDGGWGGGNTIFYLGDGNGGGSGGIPSAVRYAGGFFQGSTAATNVADNAWHQVAYVNNGGTYAIYVDGVLQPLAAGNAGFGNGDVGGQIRIGASTNTVAADGTLNFNGLLDNVQIFSQSLSAAQIASLYQGLSAGPLPMTTDLSIAGGATLDVNGVVQTIASLNGSVGSSILLGNGQLRAGSAATSTFAGSIAGSGSFVKQGTGTLTLAGANTHSGSTLVTAGTLRVTNGAALTNSAVTVNGGTLKLDAGTSSPVVVRGLAVATAGGVDLGSSGLVIDYTSADSTAGAAAIADVIAGRITSAGNPNLKVGYAFASDLGGTFQGLGLDADSIALLATYGGDTNLDKTVNFDDLLSLAQHYNTAAGATWSQGDNTYDGAVNFDDLLELAKNYGSSIAAVDVSQASASAEFAADWALAVSVVPEPTSCLAALGVIGVLARRRR